MPELPNVQRSPDIGFARLKIIVSTAKQLQNRLLELANQLLDDNRQPYTLHPEVRWLTDLLTEVTEFRINLNSDIAVGETMSPSGLAVSPTMAAMCAADYVRSIVFLRGLRQAIEDRLRQRQQPIHVLYAGSGPYALLAIPLMTLFTTNQVRWTILDIHQASIDSVTSIVSALGFADRLQGIHVEDASQYKIQDVTPDVIVSETMNACLEAEPQVTIARHLAEQAPAATLIPQVVAISAWLVDLSKEFVFTDSDGGATATRPDRQPLGQVFELSRESIQSWSTITDAQLPGQRIQVPDWDRQRYELMLFTEITVYQHHQLQVHQSSLTIPKRVTLNKRQPAGPCTLQFHYRLGNQPALIPEVIVD